MANSLFEKLMKVLKKTKSKRTKNEIENQNDFNDRAADIEAAINAEEIKYYVGLSKVVDISVNKILFTGNYAECRDYIDENIEEDSELYYNVWIKDFNEE